MGSARLRLGSPGMGCPDAQPGLSDGSRGSGIRGSSRVMVNDGKPGIGIGGSYRLAIRQRC